MLISSYVICWMPLQIFQMMKVFESPLISQLNCENTENVLTTIAWLNPVSSVIVSISKCAIGNQSNTIRLLRKTVSSANYANDTEVPWGQNEVHSWLLEKATGNCWIISPWMSYSPWQRIRLWSILKSHRKAHNDTISRLTEPNHLLHCKSLLKQRLKI